MSTETPATEPDDTGTVARKNPTFKERWARGMASLDRYTQEHGSTTVPQGYVDAEGFALGMWVANLRRRHRRSELTSDRVAQLDTVGFDWGQTTKDQWTRGITSLRRYVEEHDTAQVPLHYEDPDGFSLGKWVCDRRMESRRGRLAPDRVAELGDVPGWTWSPYQDRWERGIAALRAFVAEHGHAKVARAYRTSEDDFNLGEWVARQRDHRRNNAPRLTPARIEELDTLGFQWAPGRGHQPSAVPDRRGQPAETTPDRPPHDVQAEATPPASGTVSPRIQSR